MRKALAILLIVCAFVLPPAAQAEEWYCSGCASSATGNFCSNCGQSKSASAVEEGQYSLLLDVTFEENNFFSTYDVDVFVNGSKVTTIPHGNNYSNVITVPAGVTEITFSEEYNAEVKGTVFVGVTENTSYRCTIHAKRDLIVVDGVTTNGEFIDTRTTVGNEVVVRNIAITLTKVRISTGNGYSTPASGNVFVSCEFEIANNSDKTILISSLTSFEAFCDEFKLNIGLGSVLNNTKQLDGTLESGRKMRGELCFEVPEDWKELEVIFTPSVFSSESVTFVAFNE